MENKQDTCGNQQCHCDGSCKGLVKSDMDYTSEENTMENKIAECLNLLVLKTHTYNADDCLKDIMEVATQQKPGIDWLSEDEIRANIFPAINGLYGPDCGKAFMLGAEWAQSKLKTRIHPSDLQKEVDRLKEEIAKKDELIQAMFNGGNIKL